MLHDMQKGLLRLITDVEWAERVEAGESSGDNETPSTIVEALTAFSFDEIRHYQRAIHSKWLGMCEEYLPATFRVVKHGELVDSALQLTRYSPMIKNEWPMRVLELQDMVLANLESGERNELRVEIVKTERAFNRTRFPLRQRPSKGNGYRLAPWACTELLRISPAALASSAWMSLEQDLMDSSRPYLFVRTLYKISVYALQPSVFTFVRALEDGTDAPPLSEDKLEQLVAASAVLVDLGGVNND